jgi:hypothetical protein
MIIPSFIFLIITLTTGAAAAFSFRAYQHTKTKSTTPEAIPDKKIIEEAIKPILEENIKLKKNLAQAEAYFRDLKVAKQLAPNPENKTNQEAHKP